MSFIPSEPAAPVPVSPRSAAVKSPPHDVTIAPFSQLLASTVANLVAVPLPPPPKPITPPDDARGRRSESPREEKPVAAPANDAPAATTSAATNRPGYETKSDQAKAPEENNTKATDDPAKPNSDEEGHAVEESDQEVATVAVVQVDVEANAELPVADEEAVETTDPVPKARPRQTEFKNGKPAVLPADEAPELKPEEEQKVTADALELDPAHRVGKKRRKEDVSPGKPAAKPRTPAENGLKQAEKVARSQPLPQDKVDRKATSETNPTIETVDQSPPPEPRAKRATATVDVVKNDQPVAKPTAPSTTPLPESTAALESDAPREQPSTAPSANNTSPTANTNPVSSRLADQLLPRSAQKTGDGPSLTPTEQNRFLQRVARAFDAARNREGELRLRLSPPELGSLRLEVRVQQGAITARLEAETPAARALLIDNLPALRERLADQGIRIDQFDIDLLDRRDSSAGQQGNQSPDRDGPRYQPTLGQAPKSSVTNDAPETPAGPSRVIPGQNQQINVII